MINRLTVDDASKTRRDSAGQLDKSKSTSSSSVSKRIAQLPRNSGLTKMTKSSVEKFRRVTSVKFTGFVNGFKPDAKKAKEVKAVASEEIVNGVEQRGKNKIEWFNDFAPWLVEKRLQEERIEQERRQEEVARRRESEHYVGIAEAVELS